jgi:putative ABC transport system permease protein
VRAVQLYRGGLLDYGYRRVLVDAPAREATQLIPADQILQGNARLAEERVSAGGWAVVSQGLADEQHLHIGQAFTPPTPDPVRLRVAALSTNLGWAPGSMLINATDYARAWGSQDASAYSVVLNPNVSPTQAAQEIAHTLGPASGLTVQTAEAHAAEQVALGREALERLTQIATLIPIVAVLAMAAAMGAMVWQRRPRLAKLKLEGLPHVELWGTILLESLLLLGAGCITGAIFGLYGQQLADRALAHVQSLSLVIATALVILAVPGYMAASVSPALALQD